MGLGSGRTFSGFQVDYVSFCMIDAFATSCWPLTNGHRDAFVASQRLFANGRRDGFVGSPAVGGSAWAFGSGWALFGFTP